MAKWKVDKRLFLVGKNRFAEPGEIIELSDESAAALLKLPRSPISPAETKQAHKPVKKSKSTDKEITNDSNN